MADFKLKKHAKLKTVLTLLGLSVLIVILSSVSSLSDSGVSIGLFFILLAVAAMVAVIVSAVYLVKLYKLMQAFVNAPARTPERVQRTSRQRRKKIIHASPAVSVVEHVDEKGERELA